MFEIQTTSIEEKDKYLDQQEQVHSYLRRENIFLGLY